MDSIDFERFQRRARIKYEWSRLRRAIVGFAPALFVVVVAACVTPRPTTALLFGTAMFCAGVALLWYGQDLRRAVLPGVAAGAIPLVVALCANQLGHVCTGGACLNLCMPACGAGGIAAGLAVALLGHQSTHRIRYLAAGSVVALLTGAMGCACIGYYGLFGLAVGFGVGLLSGVGMKTKA